MNPGDPNVGIVETVAAALDTLCDELVLVGGCAASLLMDAPTAPRPRVTYDVDLIAQVAALTAYHRLERQFEDCGFRRDASPDAPICRWRYGEIMVDLMPADPRVLGFSNPWYEEAVDSRKRCTLPRGREVWLISAPAFAATKFEAFHGRGGSDVLSSHDLEDIINVVEGRVNFIPEVIAAEPRLRAYLVRCFQGLLAMPDFLGHLPGLVAHDVFHGQRVQVVAQRLSELGRLAAP